MRQGDPASRQPPRGRGDDAVDDLASEAGGVDLDRVRGGAQGAVLAALVALVALRCAASTAASSSPVCAARRRARSSAEAVRKTLSGASGLTTVPMSRPSAT